VSALFPPNIPNRTELLVSHFFVRTPTQSCTPEPKHTQPILFLLSARILLLILIGMHIMLMLSCSDCPVSHKNYPNSATNLQTTYKQTCTTMYSYETLRSQVVRTDFQTTFKQVF
jgi:hypothetical protein